VTDRSVLSRADAGATAYAAPADSLAGRMNTLAAAAAGGSACLISWQRANRRRHCLRTRRPRMGAGAVGDPRDALA
jgi:hypothetical protein